MAGQSVTISILKGCLAALLIVMAACSRKPEPCADAAVVRVSLGSAQFAIPAGLQPSFSGLGNSWFRVRQDIWPGVPARLQMQMGPPPRRYCQVSSEPSWPVTGVSMDEKSLATFATANPQFHGLVGVKFLALELGSSKLQGELEPGATDLGHYWRWDHALEYTLKTKASPIDGRPVILTCGYYHSQPLARCRGGAVGTPDFGNVLFDLDDDTIDRGRDADAFRSIGALLSALRVRGGRDPIS